MGLLVKCSKNTHSIVLINSFLCLKIHLGVVQLLHYKNEGFSDAIRYCFHKIESNNIILRATYSLIFFVLSDFYFYFDKKNSFFKNFKRIIQYSLFQNE